MSFWTWFLSFLAFFLGGLVVGTVAHEAGHLLCARIASLPLSRIVIGGGPILLRGRIADVRVELHLWPAGSWVVCSQSPRPPKRWAVPLYFLGGAAASVAVMGVVAWLNTIGALPRRWDHVLPPILTPAGALIAAQTLLMVMYPVTALLYARSPFHKRYREGATRPPISVASGASVLVAIALARADQKSRNSRRKAYALLRRVLSQESLTPDEEMWALDWLITDALRANRRIVTDPGMRPELDEWSQRVLRLGPKVKTLIGSRGVVLVELGRYQEGKALLETVAFTEGASLLDALLSRMYLARAEHALGKAAVARSLIAEALAIVRGNVRGPARTAWIARILHEASGMRSRWPHVRPACGRRSLKAHGRRFLPRPRARLRPRSTVK